MARTQKSYRVDTKNRKVILFTNIEQTSEDKLCINNYIECGYKLKTEKKISIDDMRKDLGKINEEALKEFNRLYDLNEEKGALGFHRACQFYTRFKKVRTIEKDLKDDEKALNEFKQISNLTEEGLEKAIKFYNNWKKANKNK